MLPGLRSRVDEAELARAAQRFADGLDHCQRGREREAALATQPCGQILAFEQLHHQKGRAGLDAVVVDVDRVGHLEQRGRLGLALEADARLVGLGEAGRHQLDRHVDVELEMACDPDATHGALRERPLEPVPTGDDGAAFELRAGSLAHALGCTKQKFATERPRSGLPSHAEERAMRTFRRSLGRTSRFAQRRSRAW